MKSLNERLTGNQRALIIKALERFNCILIYLFGSYGTPSEHPASDIDIAFLPSYQQIQRPILEAILQHHLDDFRIYLAEIAK